MRDHDLLEMMLGSRSVLYYVYIQGKDFKRLYIGKEVIPKIFQKTNRWSDSYL